MVRSDQLSAPLDVLAGDEIREADHAPADAVARFDDRHVVTRLRQLVSGGQPAEAGADHDRAPGPGVRGHAEAVAEEQRAGGGERPLDHFAARDSARLAVTTTELGIDIWHNSYSIVNHCTSTRRFLSESGPAGSSQPRPTMSRRLASMVYCAMRRRRIS